jgi:hypothetical protein
MSHDPSETPQTAVPPVTRRRALGVLGVMGLVATTGKRALAGQAQSTPVTGEFEAIEVTMPDWRFSLIDTVDPYVGELTKPQGVPAGFRVIGCQVVLMNMSDQPMDFSLRDIRARDADGVEYQGGDFVGTEPDVVSQNLPDGERARGWVWFGIPEATELASLVFLAPRPILRIPIG